MLARTNRELSPFAAVALELGCPIRIEDDGLLLDDERHLGRPRPARATRSHSCRRCRAAASRAGLPTALPGPSLAGPRPSTDAARPAGCVARAHAPPASDLADDALLTLATIHGTKGLEWDHVACVGHDDGTFPSGRALREADDPVRVLEEERRLAYVAWTRAVKTLTIVYDPGAPSTFVLEAFDAAELA